MSKLYDLPKRLAQQAMRECDNQLRAQHKKKASLTKVTQTIQNTTEASIMPPVSMSKSLVILRMFSFQNNTGDLK